MHDLQQTISYEHYLVPEVIDISPPIPKHEADEMAVNAISQACRFPTSHEEHEHFHKIQQETLSMFLRLEIISRQEVSPYLDV